MLGQAEIEQLHRAARRDEDVGGLQIAMENAASMGGFQRARDLDRQLQGVPSRHRTARLSTLDVFEDKIRRPDVVNLADVGVIERRDGARFLLKTVKSIGICCERGRKHLDCHVALQPLVPCAIDLAHATGAKGSHDFVGTKT